MGMGLPAVIVKQQTEALRDRTEILSDADLRLTWAGVMEGIAAKEAKGNF